MIQQEPTRVSCCVCRVASRSRARVDLVRLTGASSSVSSSSAGLGLFFEPFGLPLGRFAGASGAGSVGRSSFFAASVFSSRRACAGVVVSGVVSATTSRGFSICAGSSPTDSASSVGLMAQPAARARAVVCHTSLEGRKSLLSREGLFLGRTVLIETESNTSLLSRFPGRTRRVDPHPTRLAHNASRGSRWRRRRRAPWR